MPKFSNASKDRLAQCDERLQRIMNKVIEHYDCSILTGHRTEEQQELMYSSVPQRSKLRWPMSKHNKIPSVAVDVAPYPIPYEWGEDWRDRVKFYELKAIIFYVASKQGVKIRFGGDWDMDKDYKDNKFNDLVHFEIVE